MIKRLFFLFLAGFPATSPPVGSEPGKVRTATGNMAPPLPPQSGSVSSPDAQEPEDFVMVPAHLTMDAAENRKTLVSKRGQGQSRRHTVSGDPHRPSNLPMQIGPTSEPIPVPTQKAAYQQIQASLVRSRNRSGDSVSAMSGISSASGGSTLGPLPEERLPSGKMDRPEQSPAGARKLARVSPLTSPRSPTARPLVARKISAPPIPDICQMSPPNVQFTLGSTPPTGTGFGHRRRTSSSSSCGTPPPPGQWQISPNSPATGGAAPGFGKVVPTMSPSRRGGVNIPSSVGNIPALSPIQGSPNKCGGAAGGVDPNPAGIDDPKALMQWENTSIGGQQRACTVPENLSSYNERRKSSDCQLVSGRNVVLNYGSGAFDRSSKFLNNSGLNIIS